MSVSWCGWRESAILIKKKSESISEIKLFGNRSEAGQQTVRGRWKEMSLGAANPPTGSSPNHTAEEATAFGQPAATHSSLFPRCYFFFIYRWIFFPRNPSTLISTPHFRGRIHGSCFRIVHLKAGYTEIVKGHQQGTILWVLKLTTPETGCHMNAKIFVF